MEHTLSPNLITMTKKELQNMRWVNQITETDLVLQRMTFTTEKEKVQNTRRIDLLMGVNSILARIKIFTSGKLLRKMEWTTCMQASINLSTKKLIPDTHSHTTIQVTNIHTLTPNEVTIQHVFDRVPARLNHDVYNVFFLCSVFLTI